MSTISSTAVFSLAVVPIDQVKKTEMEVNDFKYIGSFVANSKKDFSSRKGQAWAACNKVNYIVWQSDIAKSTKIKFFRACVESILLYGAEMWAISKEL